MPELNSADVKARPRLPPWLRITLPTTDRFAHTRALLDELRLQTGKSDTSLEDTFLALVAEQAAA